MCLCFVGYHSCPKVLTFFSKLQIVNNSEVLGLIHIFKIHIFKMLDIGTFAYTIEYVPLIRGKEKLTELES